MGDLRIRRWTKDVLGWLGAADRGDATGATLLIYHRVGGGTGDELDLPTKAFEQHLDVLRSERHDVVSLDVALDRLEAGDASPSVVLTFDDGFADVHANAFPRLADRGMPFTVYLAAGLVGGAMAWEGSSARSQGSRALSWEQVAEMHATGLCTVGNHTWSHASPEVVSAEELDRCSAAVQEGVGQAPSHFAWTWGVPVEGLLPDVRARFRSAATGDVGRNVPGDDLHALRRVPVRASDPLRFFRAKLVGRLWPERTYGSVVRVAKGRGHGIGS